MNHLHNLISTVQQRLSAGGHWIVKQLRLIIALTVIVYIALWLYSFSWSGFGSYKDSDGKVVPAKTLWDWLGLLIIPAFLAVGGLWLNTTVQGIERERAEKRAEVDRKIADDRLREQALQSYFDRISDLLLSGQLEKQETKDNASAVARARTLALVRGLNRDGREAVLQFLYESKLIIGDTPSISLKGAAFAHVVLQNIDLKGAYLEGAYLGEAALGLTHLENANLRHAWLNATSLADTHFEGANLEGAIFIDANLNGTHLEGANLTEALIDEGALEKAILDENTILPDGSLYKIPSTPTP